MDYLKFYQLEAEPFRNEPDPRFYFESATHARTRLRIARAVTQRLGMAVLLGGPGCGKTTLAHGIEASLADDGSLVRRISIPRSDCDGSWLLCRIASEFGVPDRSSDPLQALDQLEKRLVGLGDQGRHPVLLLDEAQMLRDPARMEELRALLNLAHPDGRRAVTVVLFGLPELLEALERDPSLLQRVEIRQELQPLAREEAIAYLAHRVERAGGAGDLFTSEAADALAQLSGGVPRLLNSLADNALFEGALARTRPVDASLVAAACEAVGIEISCDLRFLPAAEAANMELSAPAPELRTPEPTPAFDDLDETEPATEIDVSAAVPAVPAGSEARSASASGAEATESEDPDLQPPVLDKPLAPAPRPAELTSPSFDETTTLDPEAAMFESFEPGSSDSMEPSELDDRLSEDSLLGLDFELTTGDTPPGNPAECEGAGAGDDSEAADDNSASQILGASSFDFTSAPLSAEPEPEPEPVTESTDASVSGVDLGVELDQELELDLDSSPEPSGDSGESGDKTLPDDAGSALDEDLIGAFEFEGEGDLELSPSAPVAVDEATESAVQAAPAAAPEPATADASSDDAPNAPNAPRATDSDDEESLDLLDSLFEDIQI